MNDENTPHEDEAMDNPKNNKQGQAPDPFDPDSLRATADDINTIGAEKILLRIRVRKPNKQEFIRTHHGSGYRLICYMLEIKDEREFYIISPKIIHSLVEDVRHVELRLCINRQGDVFFWPVSMPSADGRINSWHESAREAAAHAEKHWIRMIANMSEGGYTIYEATGEIPDPQWPEKTLNELLKLAFKDGKLIDSADHPIVQYLRGA